MIPTFTLTELNADTGVATANGLRNVANQAANFACNLYKNYSDAATGLPDPTGLGAALNGFYSNLCGPRGSNPTTPPSTPFTGGQCSGPGKNYNVTVNYSGPSGPGSLFFPGIPGPIASVGMKSFTSTSGSYGVIAPNASAYNGILNVASASGPNWQGALSGYKVTGVTCSPIGFTDNCGDPGQQYNTPPPPNNSVVNNSNTVNVGAGLIINAPISIVPITNIANVAIRPQIQVNVGPFNVTFDAGGVYVQPNFQIGSDKQTPPAVYLPPSSPSPTPPATPDANPCDLSSVISAVSTVSGKVDAVKTELDDVKNCACPVLTTPASTTLGSGISGYASLPANCIKVALTLNSIPANAKTQKSNGSEPTNYFCGYYYWGDGTGRTERIPISVVQSVFFKPDWATAFGWNLYLGYSATAVATYLVPSKSNSEFGKLQMKLKPT